LRGEVRVLAKRWKSGAVRNRSLTGFRLGDLDLLHRRCAGQEQHRLFLTAAHKTRKSSPACLVERQHAFGYALKVASVDVVKELFEIARSEIHPERNEGVVLLLRQGNLDVPIEPIRNLAGLFLQTSLGFLRRDSLTGATLRSVADGVLLEVPLGDRGEPFLPLDEVET